MPYSCGGCKDEIKRQRVVCPRCKTSFHQTCVNYKGPQTLPANKVAADWLCPDCTSKSRRGGDNSNTPLRTPSTLAVEAVAGAGKSSDADADVSESDSDTAGLPTTITTVKLDDNIIAAVQLEIRKSLKGELSSTIKTLLQRELAPIRQDLIDLKHSLEFFNNKYEEHQQSIQKLTNNIASIESNICNIQPSLSILEDRVNELEQQLREANLEFQGIPEFKSENLRNLVQQVATVISHPIPEADVIHCTRVAKINKNNNKPRTVVLKLRNRRCRDELYSAIARYNKANPNNKLSTPLLGIAGTSSPVYVSEQLSPYYKKLHAAARIKARELQYKFVRVRYGRIYVTKDENTVKPILIKNYGSLELIQ